MKKFTVLSIFSAVLVFLGISLANAQISIAETSRLKNEDPVVLEGKIVQDLGDNQYILSDYSGSIQVEIGTSQWEGLEPPQPHEVIEVHGEMDKDSTTNRVESIYIVRKYYNDFYE